MSGRSRNAGSDSLVAVDYGAVDYRLQHIAVVDTVNVEGKGITLNAVHRLSGIENRKSVDAAASLEVEGAGSRIGGSGLYVGNNYGTVAASLIGILPIAAQRYEGRHGDRRGDTVGSGGHPHGTAAVECSDVEPILNGLGRVGDAGRIGGKIRVGNDVIRNHDVLGGILGFYDCGCHDITLFKRNIPIDPFTRRAHLGRNGLGRGIGRGNLLSAAGGKRKDHKYNKTKAKHL